MIANQLLSRRTSRKRKADDGNDRSMEDRRRDTKKSSSKRLKTIGDYRAALYIKQVSSKVSTKVSDFKKHLLRKEEGLTSQQPIIKPEKKVITLEEYRRRQKTRSKIAKKATAKSTQPPCEEVPTLEDITPYLLAYNDKKRKHDGEVSDGEGSETEYKFVLGKKRKSLHFYQQKWLHSWESL